jgi:basic membrane protein A
MGVLIIVILMISCNNSRRTSDSQGAKSLRIGVICSASGQNDNGYNQSACDGLRTVSEQIGAEFKIVEPINGVPSALETMAEDGYNLIFSLEYDFDALIKGVGGAKPIAEQYSNTWFVIFNDSPNIGQDDKPLFNNVIAVMFNVHEASYLAGYLSVLTNENMDVLFPRDYKLTPLSRGRGIGFIGGTDSAGIRVYSYGFMMGINAAAEEYGVSYDYYAKYDAGFTDPALGSTVAGTMYDSGANIVFADCGVVGDGITARAKEAGKIAIQTDANLDAQQPGHVVTSVLKITGVPVVTISKALADGTIDSMDKVQNYDLASGATGITDLTEMGKHVADIKKWEEIKARVAEVAENIKSSRIKVVNAQIGETFDPVSCPRVRIK